MDRHYSLLEKTVAGVGLIFGQVVRPVIYALNYATEGVSFDQYADELISNRDIDEFVKSKKKIVFSLRR